jgi:protein gp37
MAQTKIEWCDRVWNPITGCSPVSDGCQNCYAKRMANRLKGRYGYSKDDPFRVTFHPDRLKEPVHWKKPSRIFVCSMGDLFHDDVDGEWLKDIFSIIRAYPHHTFLILTKRPQNVNKRYFDYFGHTSYSHVWLGVSVEDQKTADERIPILLQILAAYRFVSVEPMLSNIILKKEWFERIHYKYGGEHRKGPLWDGIIIPGISWVICGSESGPKRRPCKVDWIRNLKNQCINAGIPFFLKQGPGYLNGKSGIYKMPELDGQEWRQFPK